MADRCTLHISRLEDFKKFLIDENIAFRPGKGTWEVLQIQTQGGWYKIYRKNDMPEHYVAQDKVMPLIRKFVNQKHKVRDSQREMLGGEADYFEAAGIDNIGCK